MKRWIALIIAMLMLTIAALPALAEEGEGYESAAELKGDAVPPLPDYVAAQIGQIPETPEELLAREDVAELDALLKAWDADAMVRDLLETGTHTFQNMDHSWVSADADGEELTLEVSGDQVTLTMAEKVSFEFFELQAATDSESRSIFLVTEVDPATGAAMQQHVFIVSNYNDEEHGFFYYSLNLKPDGCDLWIDAGQDTLRQVWQISYDAEGNVKDKSFVEEDLSQY